MPSHMAPRLVEIAPGDVIWDNMSMKWWERYLRIIIVVAIVVGLVFAWAVPVSFVTGLANLSDLETKWPHIFGFIGNISLHKTEAPILLHRIPFLVVIRSMHSS